MAYSKPQVTIDLEEYNELKAIDVENYQIAFKIMLNHLTINPHVLRGFSGKLASAGLQMSSDDNDRVTVVKIEKS